MSERKERSIELERPTAAGCVVLVLTFLVICGTALPIVQWRDPETGQPLPRMIAIFAPFLVAAAFYAAIAGILNLLGVRTSRKGEPLKMDEPARASDKPREAESTEFFEKRNPRKD